ncbi:MAG: secretion protein HlyD [Gammaproteobacteria bacterium]|jgi:HlyD family secretion protein
MTVTKRLLIVVVLVTVVAAAAIFWSRVDEENNSDSLTLYGNVDIREVELAFRVAGRLETMHFDEGDSVEAGEIVAEIDPVPYEHGLAVAAARVGQAQANLDRFESGSRPQEIARAAAAVTEARAANDNARRELERQSGLLESGASSQRTVDAARSRRDETAARLAAAREALALAEEGFRDEDIAAAEADLAAAVAQRAQSETQLDDTRLVAPNGGTLIARIREPGSMLAAGMPVYSLSLRDPVYVRAYIDEPHLGRIAPGMAVTITTDSSDETYAGEIGFISPRAEFTPRSVETTELRTDLVYRLRIVVPESDEGLRQGMPVTVNVPLDATGR